MREHGDRVPQRPPNSHLTTELADLAPGRALDAGCGHGAETLWLAARGWQVTALDYAATALAHARSTAEAIAADVAERIDWVEADLATWAPDPEAYDLVVSLYVHVAGSVEELVQRLAAGVASGARSSSSATNRSTRSPERRRPPPDRCRSRLRRCAQLSIRVGGSSSSPTTVDVQPRLPGLTP